MGRDEDSGQGDVDKFPAEELEKLYKSTVNGDIRIRGDALNDLLKVKSYDKKAWYVVTDRGVEKL